MLPIPASTATCGVLLGNFKILNRALTYISSIILNCLLLSAMFLLHIILPVLSIFHTSLALHLFSSA